MKDEKSDELNEHAPAGSITLDPTLDECILRDATEVLDRVGELCRNVRTFGIETTTDELLYRVRDLSILVLRLAQIVAPDQREPGTASSTSTSRARSNKKDLAAS
jgi:hypothetical protein